MDTTLHSHKPYRIHHQFFFLCRQDPAHLIAVALHIAPKKIQIQLDIAKFLILGKCGRTGAHRIAKIQNGCSRHHRIQIDQTDGFLAVTVDQHIAVSCIVMCDTLRDLF